VTVLFSRFGAGLPFDLPYRFSTFAYVTSSIWRCARRCCGVCVGSALCALMCGPAHGSCVKPFSSSLATESFAEESLAVKEERRGSRVHSQYQQLHSA
jgi:hypothetical protein